MEIGSVKCSKYIFKGFEISFEAEVRRDGDCLEFFRFVDFDVNNWVGDNDELSENEMEELKDKITNFDVDCWEIAE